ncbi:Pfs domain-containing protein [Fusarium coicis]|nr:Pfs domain-containing protein [Fusarium coicis]
MDDFLLPDIDTVLEQFKQTLQGKKDLENFKATTLDTLKDSISEIQAKQHARRQLQNLNRLAPFLEATKQYGDLAHLFYEGDEIMPFIWGPMKFLLETASSPSSPSKSFDKLVGLYEKLGEALPLLKQYEDFFRARPHQAKVLAVIYKEITIFHRIILNYAKEIRADKDGTTTQQKLETIKKRTNEASDFRAPSAAHKEIQATLDAPQTDSGYLSTHANISHDNRAVDNNNDDASTEYCTTSSLTSLESDKYIETFARHLASHTRGLSADEATQTRISTILPPLLKAFALQVGQQTQLPLNRKAMSFVHTYRREIAETFENIQFNRDPEGLPETFQPSTSNDSIDRRGFLDDWFKRVESPSRCQENEQNHQASPEPTITESDPVSIEESSILQTTAFEWLLSRLLKEFHLTPIEPYAIQSIGEGILAALPPPRSISRKTLTPTYNASIELECNLLQFFERQKYSRHPHEVFDGVIALTGSCYDVQAATCGQYLSQTWPSTAPYILEVLRDCLMLRPGAPQTVSYPDGTTLKIRVDTYTLKAEVNGMAATVAEIGEQLAWLGAAFHERPDENGLICCIPNIIVTSEDLPSFPSHSQPARGVDFRINFDVQTVDGNQNTNGQCWQSLFKSPILVRGYPIPCRSEWNVGLEASLDIMAGLAQADQIHAFGDNFYIKGYCTMLVPTRRSSDIQYWHLIHRTDGGRLSHFPDDMTEERYVGSMKDLDQFRHILGWCSEAESLLGMNFPLSTCGIVTNFNITSGLFNSPRTQITCSMLPKCEEGAALAGEAYKRERHIARISNYFPVTEDTAPSIGSVDYDYRLRLLEAQFFLLWDEKEKRGWLINGATALLRAVEECVAPDMNGDSRSALLFGRHCSETAREGRSPSVVQILNDRKYQKLLLYGEGNIQTTVGDKIKELCSIFEYFIDLQNHSKTTDRLRGKSRKYLEGWDFEDVVSNFRTFHARQATLETLGKEWVDFIRAIKAVTLFGQGFGEIIRPQRTCKQWTTLPTGKYYIATLISDLYKVLKEHGHCGDGHLRLGDNLIWHSATPGSDFCKCKDLSQQLGGRHRCEPVQICFPLNLAESLNSRKNKMPDSNEGALIWGHNSQFPWFWDDIGNPKKRNDIQAPCPPQTTQKSITLSSDSGIGSSMSRSQVETPDRQRSRSQDSFAEPSRKKQKTATTTFPVEANSTESHVGIICALPHELAAVRATFDVTLEKYKKVEGDANYYFTGKIAQHNVVATCLPRMGTNHAASTAKDMSRSYNPSLCLLVGIGGGVPSEKHDIRLGDVVVGNSVVQYDFGSETEADFQIKDRVLQSSPSDVENLVSSLCSDPVLLRSSIDRYLCEITAMEGMAHYCHPGHERDILDQCCSACRSVHQLCEHFREREQRMDSGVRVHYGKIASGNKVIKRAAFRDEIAAKHDVKCFEMEAAGIANTMPYLVVRGISDYCDGNKNDDWHEYAAATAAAYAKLLLMMPLALAWASQKGQLTVASLDTSWVTGTPSEPWQFPAIASSPFTSPASASFNSLGSVEVTWTWIAGMGATGQQVALIIPGEQPITTIVERPDVTATFTMAQANNMFSPGQKITIQCTAISPGLWAAPVTTTFSIPQSSQITPYSIQALPPISPNCTMARAIETTWIPNPDKWGFAGVSTISNTGSCLASIFVSSTNQQIWWITETGAIDEKVHNGNGWASPGTGASEAIPFNVAGTASTIDGGSMTSLVLEGNTGAILFWVDPYGAIACCTWLASSGWKTVFDALPRGTASANTVDNSVYLFCVSPSGAVVGGRCSVIWHCSAWGWIGFLQCKHTGDFGRMEKTAWTTTQNNIEMSLVYGGESPQNIQLPLTIAQSVLGGTGIAAYSMEANQCSIWWIGQSSDLRRTNEDLTKLQATSTPDWPVFEDIGPGSCKQMRSLIVQPLSATEIYLLYVTANGTVAGLSYTS